MRQNQEAEAAHRAASEAERVIWVDADDQVQGILPRAQLCADGLIGRAAFILLFNSAGELCVHRRSLGKALYPGYWDIAAGGMVGVGESYAECAARELREELGVRAGALNAHGRFFFDQADNRLWGAVFSVVSDAPLTLQPEEVLEARFMPLAAVRSLSGQGPVCPDSLVALDIYLAQVV